MSQINLWCKNPCSNSIQIKSSRATQSLDRFTVYAFFYQSSSTIHANSSSHKTWINLWKLNPLPTYHFSLKKIHELSPNQGLIFSLGTSPMLIITALCARWMEDLLSTCSLNAICSGYLIWHSLLPFILMPFKFIPCLHGFFNGLIQTALALLTRGNLHLYGWPITNRAIARIQNLHDSTNECLLS